MLSGSHGTATVSLVFGGAAAARVVGALRNRSFGTVRGCGRAGSVDRCHGFSLFDPRRPVIVPEVEPPSARGMTASQPPGLCTGGRIPPYPCGRCRDRRRRPPQPGAVLAGDFVPGSNRCRMRGSTSRRPHSARYAAGCQRPRPGCRFTALAHALRPLGKPIRLRCPPDIESSVAIPGARDQRARIDWIFAPSMTNELTRADPIT